MTPYCQKDIFWSGFRQPPNLQGIYLFVNNPPRSYVVYQMTLDPTKIDLDDYFKYFIENLTTDFQNNNITVNGVNIYKNNSAVFDCLCQKICCENETIAQATMHRLFLWRCGKFPTRHMPFFINNMRIVGYRSYERTMSRLLRSASGSMRAGMDSVL